MFKWPRAPSPRASEHELADYAELKCWEQGSTSLSDIGRTLGGLEENDYYSGVPEEDAAPQAVEAAFVEIERRQEACAEGYPFVLRRPGSTLHMGNECDNKKCIVYHYLLLATRLDMANDRVHGGVDGTVLFEELSGEAAREYFGNRAESVVFGTAAGVGGFPSLPGSMNSAKDCGREAATRAWWGMHRTGTMANSTSQYGNHFAMTFRES